MFDKKNFILAVFCLVVLDIVFWFQILSAPKKIGPSELYFLEVGQGDAELLKFPGGVKILIDGGPNNSVLSGLDSVLSPFDRYIDLIVLSHPETDHFGGLIEVIKRYQAGIFLWGGQKATATGFKDLTAIVNDKKLKSLIISEGDKIRYRDSVLEVVSPPKNLTQKLSINDSSLVLKLFTGGISALFTGDIGFLLENDILTRHDLNIDVLKVGHHGSKNSSGEEFLKKLSPEVAVIGVGKNSYGHPTKEVLGRLASVGAQIFRTDNDGTVKLVFEDGQIRIWKKKTR